MIEYNVLINNEKEFKFIEKYFLNKGYLWVYDLYPVIFDEIKNMNIVYPLCIFNKNDNIGNPQFISIPQYFDFDVIKSNPYFKFVEAKLIMRKYKLNKI